MSSRRSAPSETPAPPIPDWFAELLGGTPVEGERLVVNGYDFEVRNGIPRALSEAPASSGTADVFGFLWSKEDHFRSDGARKMLREWYRERYGDIENAPWWDDYGAAPLVLDAGCGAGLSALELFGGRLRKVRYLGVDVSAAVDGAAARFGEAGIAGAFMQADFTDLAFAPGTFDVVFSQGALHHAESTEDALKSLVRLLKPGGRFLFYVYGRKGPIREFTDDFVRGRLKDMDHGEAWRAMMPLTRLGRALGELDIEIEVPEDIDLLDIPAGKIDLQRLFYWHVFKAFYHPDLGLEEMNHINFDWYAPRYAHRQTPEEVRRWCAEAGLDVEHENVQESGITVIARRTG